MSRKQKKKPEKKKENDMSSLRTFYLNCKRSDKEDRAIQRIKEYMQAREASTSTLVMCEFIEEYLPKATQRAKKRRQKLNKAS